MPNTVHHRAHRGTPAHMDDLAPRLPLRATYISIHSAHEEETGASHLFPAEVNARHVLRIDGTSPARQLSHRAAWARRADTRNDRGRPGEPGRPRTKLTGESD
ncbi:hypothetical protein Misp04_28610 [Micromonospora sp. NBRC 101691]|nr:hypothetical protein Misp04_28610 [Micromonospora sp. NBRC 101691]